MANRFRELFESIVYAGMKPSTRSSPQAPDAPAGKPGFLKGFLARFLAGPDPSDPLYLSRQTPAQRVRRFLVAVIPVAVVMVVAIVGIVLFAPKKIVPRAPVQTALVLPAFNKEIKLNFNKDVEVTEVHFDHSHDSLMIGGVRNLTDHQINEAVMEFDLVDHSGSQLGGVTITLNNLAPREVRAFKQPVDQTTAAGAIVREAHTN